MITNVDRRNLSTIDNPVSHVYIKVYVLYILWVHMMSVITLFQHPLLTLLNVAENSASPTPQGARNTHKYKLFPGKMTF